MVESCLCTIPSVAYLLVYSFQMQMVTNFICLHETFLSSPCYIQAIMWAAYFYCSCWESFRSSWGTNIDIIINRRLPWKTVRVSWINSHPPSLPRQDLPQRCLLISAYFYRAVCLSVCTVWVFEIVTTMSGEDTVLAECDVASRDKRLPEFRGSVFPSS